MSNGTNVANNATGVPYTGPYNITSEQFFCQMTKRDVQCMSSAEFAQQPLDQLCPSGDCWSDCQDLYRLYSPLPKGVTFSNQSWYGTPPNITLWTLCNGLENITVAVENGVIPEQDSSRIKSYMSNDTIWNIKQVAAATTQCWTETCASSRNSEPCLDACAAVNLLETRTSPQMAGTRDCIQALCANVDGLPFANQDVVGIGVTVSYGIQTFLVLLTWTILSVASFLYWRRTRRARGAKPLTDSWNKLVEAIAGFHAAQCYFSIPLAIAAFFNNPFTLDPLNAFGLLPVALNGFTPPTFTLVMLFYFQDILSDGLLWYPILLVDISYILNSILMFCVVKYLLMIDPSGTSLKAPAFESLGGIDSCGGLTAIGICLQFQANSPPATLMQEYGSVSYSLVRIAPFIWGFVTLCLLIVNYLKFRTTSVGRIFEGLFHRQREAISPRLSAPTWLRVLRGAPVYYVATTILMIGLYYQGYMFWNYIRLGLVDVDDWTLGQIIAVTLWIPPVIDYFYIQGDHAYEKIKTPKTPSAPFQDTQPLANGSTAYDPTGLNQQNVSFAQSMPTYDPSKNPNVNYDPLDDDYYSGGTPPNTYPLQQSSRGRPDA